jgi:Domain of unknown function (DUF1876)/Domain of unknown function (DUF1918)
MKAYVGDRIVIAPRTAGGPVRDGEIVETRGDSGAPPYLVRWSDSGKEALYFPGVDAHIAPSDLNEIPPAEASATGGLQPDVGRHVRSWSIAIDLFENGDDTQAHIVLSSDAPGHLDAHGAAHRRTGDLRVPEIGDEIAVARALRHLADRLLDTASADLTEVEGRPVTVSGT